MKIAVLCESSQKLGGGFSFIRNFTKGLIGRGEITNWQKADIILIPSASMVSKETFRLLKDNDKKIVLRIDNIPRNSRNRGTGTSRLKMMADNSDLIIYQSYWAKDYVGYFLQKEGIIIYNGIDTSIYNTQGRKDNICVLTNPPIKKNIYLYSRFNRDETKRWEWAWYRYQLIQREDPNAKLLIVGQFSPEQLQYNFDFYNNERIEYLGIINNDENMAKIYKQCDYLIACYSNDCYSNTYQEAMACGVELFEPDMSGGTPELIKNGVIDYKDMVTKYLQVFHSIL